MTTEQTNLDITEQDDREDWERKEISEVADINPGSINDDSFTFDKIKYIDISSVGKGFIEELTEYELEDAPSRAKRTVEEGDTLLSRVRPIREQFTLIREPPDNLVASTGFAVLRANEKIDERFLYYASTTPEMITWMDNHTSGSAYPAVNLSTLKNAEIPVPPLFIQKKIGKTLHKIDSKINTNGEIIKTLEKLSKALFKSWFINFEPYQNFKDSELGEIPESFEVIEIGDLGEIITGNTPSTKNQENYGGNIPFVTASDLVGPLMISKTDKNLTQEGALEIKNKQINRGCVMVSCIGNGLGKVGVNLSSAYTNQQINSISPDNEFDTWYLLFKLKSIRKKLQNYAGGSAQPILSKSEFSNIRIAVPPEKKRREFKNKVSNSMKLYENIQNQNYILEEMRDVLLPKLVSGEIRVDELELNALEIDREV